jgi:hypothetical protein
MKMISVYRRSLAYELDIIIVAGHRLLFLMTIHTSESTTFTGLNQKIHFLNQSDIQGSYLKLQQWVKHTCRKIRHLVKIWDGNSTSSQKQVHTCSAGFDEMNSLRMCHPMGVDAVDLQDLVANLTNGKIDVEEMYACAPNVQQT